MALKRNEFPRIIRNLGPRVGAAIQAGGEIIERGAKERVPVDQGDLRDAIHKEQDGPLRVRVVAGDSDAFYGHLVEFGTSHNPPQPFLVPATEAAKAEVLGLVTASLRRL